MSNQQLSSNRFKRTPANSAPVNSLKPRQVQVHDPVSRRRRVLNVENAAPDAIIQVEPSLVDCAENFMLRVDVSQDNSADKQKGWGIDIIKSIQCKSGGELIHNYPSYKHFMRWCLSECDSVRREQVILLCFGGADGNTASTCYLPLPYCGDPFKKGFKDGTPLAIRGMGRRPITWEVTFNSAANISGSSATTFTKCQLEYDELMTNDQSQFGKPFSIHEKDVKQFPATALAAGVLKKESGLESMQGAWNSLFISNITNAKNVPAQDKTAVEPLDLIRLTLDGVEYNIGADDSEQRQRLNCILEGSKDADQCNRISFNRDPHNKDHSGGVAHTDGFKRIEIELSDSAACEAVIQAVCERTFFVRNKNIAVREG